MAQKGGANGFGTIFLIGSSPALHIPFTTMYSFAGNSDGATPFGSLTLSKDGKTLYGMTSQGGRKVGNLFDFGTVFQISTLFDSTLGNYPYQILYRFDSNGIPIGSLTLSADGNTLYGILTGSPALNTFGTVFSLNLQNVAAGLHTLYAFSVAIQQGGQQVSLGKAIYTNLDGANPYGSLTLASDGSLYGMTSIGGTYGYGTVFKISPDEMFSTLYTFTGNADGGTFYGKFTNGSLVLDPVTNTLYGMMPTGLTNSGMAFPGTVFHVGTSAGGINVFHTFTGGTDGGNPQGSLILSPDGKTVYGMSGAGGANGGGTVFRIDQKPGIPYFDTTARFTVLHQFGPNAANTNGAYPQSPLVANNAALLNTALPGFYLTTLAGGASNDGALYNLTFPGSAPTPTNASFAKKADFNAATTGRLPGGLSIFITFSGVTEGGSGAMAGGGVFTYDGTTLAATPLGLAGSHPLAPPLLLAPSIPLVPTLDGGTNGAGGLGVFNPGLVFTSPFGTSATDGANPVGGAVQVNNTVYGTTRNGGAFGQGTIYRFSLNLATRTTVYSFGGMFDGASPQGALIADGTLLYGTTTAGGSHGTGTVFAFDTAQTSNATDKILYSFGAASNNTDGMTPVAGVTANAASGATTLYGVCSAGGSNGAGTAFALDLTGSPSYRLLHSFGGTTFGIGLI